MAAEDWFASPGRGISEIYKNSFGPAALVRAHHVESAPGCP